MFFKKKEELHYAFKPAEKEKEESKRVCFKYKDDSKSMGAWWNLRRKTGMPLTILPIQAILKFSIISKVKKRIKKNGK